jgi:hypothetical protein
MVGVLCPDPSAGERTGKKRGERDKRSGARQAAGSRKGEAEEHDVARHVGDEHVSQLQVAGGVHEPRDDRERNHHRGQGTVAVAWERVQRLDGFAEDPHVGPAALAPVEMLTGDTDVTLQRPCTHEELHELG